MAKLLSSLSFDHVINLILLVLAACAGYGPVTSKTDEIFSEISQLGPATRTNQQADTDPGGVSDHIDREKK